MGLQPYERVHKGYFDGYFLHVYLRPYVYSFCQIFQTLRLLPALRVFWSKRVQDRSIVPSIKPKFGNGLFADFPFFVQVGNVKLFLF